MINKPILSFKITTPRDSSERDTLTKMRANNFQFSIGDCEILRPVNKKQAQKCDIFFSKSECVKKRLIVNYIILQRF